MQMALRAMAQQEQEQEEQLLLLGTNHRALQPAGTLALKMAAAGRQAQVQAHPKRLAAQAQAGRRVPMAAELLRWHDAPVLGLGPALALAQAP